MQPSVQREVRIQDYWYILNKRKYILILTLSAVIFIVLFINHFQKPLYESSTTLVIEREEPKILLGQGRLAVSSFDQTYFLTQYHLIQSRPIAEKVLSKVGGKTARDLRGSSPKLFKLPRFFKPSFFKPQNPPSYLPSYELSDLSLIALIQGSIKISPVPNTRMFRIIVRGAKPEATTAVANAVAEVYIDQYMQSQLSATQQSFSFLTKQIGELKEKINMSETALLETKPTLDSEKLADLKSRYTKTKNERFEAELQLKQLKDSSTLIIKPTLQALKKKLSNLKSQLKEQLKRYKEKYPTVVKLKKEIALTEKSLVEERKRLINNLEIKSEVLKEKEKVLLADLNKYEKEKEEFEKRKVQYSILAKEVTTNKELYDVLLKKLKESDVAGDFIRNKVMVVEPARQPREPIKPRKGLNLLLGMLVGLSLGTGLAFFREYLDKSIKSTEDVERVLELPVLGIIPSEEREKEGKPFFKPILEESSKSSISESYRSLRTNLQFSSIDKPLKTVLVTSSVEKEGKSTIVANLGISLAQTEKKVLIVDTDLRRPVMHKFFEIDNGKGIISVLVEDYPLESALHFVNDNLAVLTSGPLPPNPAELLSSEKMKKFIKLVPRQFDIVLFDSSPLIPVTDPSLLASELDGVLLVIRTGQTAEEACQRSKLILEKVKAQILGAVLNDVSARTGDYYYYYDSYGYYGDKGKR